MHPHTCAVARRLTRSAVALGLALGLLVGMPLSIPAQARQPAFVSKELRLSASPRAMAMAPDGRSVYAIYPGDRFLAFDARSGTKSAAQPLGSEATSLAASGSMVVVAAGDPVQALVIQAGNPVRSSRLPGKVTARVPIGPGTGVVAMAPGGSSAWIGHRDGIALLALPSATITGAIALPGQVRRIVFAASRAWVLSEVATISVLDAASGAVLVRRDLPEPVSDIAVDPSGSALFAALPGADLVQTLDPSTLQSIEQAAAGTDPVALVVARGGAAVIALGAKDPAYLRTQPLRFLGMVTGLGPASLAVTSGALGRGWIAGGRTAWIVELAAQPKVTVQVEPTKSGLQGFPAIELLKQRVDVALAGDIRILGSGTMEYEGTSGTAPMRLEVVRSGTTSYQDDGRTITYMSTSEVCSRTSSQSNFTCRVRGAQEADLVEQFRLSMPWERSGTASTAYAPLDALSRTAEPIDVRLLFAPGPIGAAASGTTSYRLIKGAFSIQESFGNGPYYEITTRISKPKEALPQELSGLPRR